MFEISQTRYSLNSHKVMLFAEYIQAICPTLILYGFDQISQAVYLVKAGVKALLMLLTKKTTIVTRWLTLRCAATRFVAKDIKCPHMPTLGSPKNIRTSATSYTSTVRKLSEVARCSHAWMRDIDKRSWIQILYFVVSNSFVQISDRPDSSWYWDCSSGIATWCMVKTAIMVTRQFLQVEDSCHQPILDIPHELLELQDFKRHDAKHAIETHRDTHI